MEKLGLNTFLAGSRDFEAGQYAVLQGLRGYYNEFSHNRLYPSLAALVELHSVLQDIINKRKDIEDRIPQQLKDIDLENKKLVYQPLENNELQHATGLIEWALPRIQQAIDEGVSIYNFVDEHITIEQVGIMPMYREEGYWFVPEDRAGLLHLFRYEVSLFTSSRGRYRTLKTTVVESIEQKLVRHSPESIKLELIARFHDLPNPATYACETDLEFPYSETMLPVAKRKLIAQVFS